MNAPAVLALPGSLLAGYVMLHQVDGFIRQKGGVPLPVPQGRALLWLFSLFLTVYLADDAGTAAQGLVVACFTGFLFPLTAFDLACCWLPLEYCLSFGAGGLLLTQFPGTGLHPGDTVPAALLMLITLSLLWWALNRLYRWRMASPEAVCLGYGDVVLLSVMCLWLPLPVVSLTACGAWGLILVWSWLIPGATHRPLAPCLALSTGVYFLFF